MGSRSKPHAAVAASSATTRHRPDRLCGRTERRRLGYSGRHIGPQNGEIRICEQQSMPFRGFRVLRHYLVVFGRWFVSDTAMVSGFTRVVTRSVPVAKCSPRPLVVYFRRSIAHPHSLKEVLYDATTEAAPRRIMLHRSGEPRWAVSRIRVVRKCSYTVRQWSPLPVIYHLFRAITVVVRYPVDMMIEFWIRCRQRDH